MGWRGREGRGGGLGGPPNDLWETRVSWTGWEGVKNQQPPPHPPQTFPCASPHPAHRRALRAPGRAPRGEVPPRGVRRRRGIAMAGRLHEPQARSLARSARTWASRPRSPLRGTQLRLPRQPEGVPDRRAGAWRPRRPAGLSGPQEAPHQQPGRAPGQPRRPSWLTLSPPRALNR